MPGSTCARAKPCGGRVGAVGRPLRGMPRPKDSWNRLLDRAAAPRWGRRDGAPEGVRPPAHASDGPPRSSKNGLENVLKLMSTRQTAWRNRIALQFHSFERRINY